MHMGSCKVLHPVVVYGQLKFSEYMLCMQRIRFWHDAGWDGFKKFLIDQLRFLMSGLMDSKELARQLNFQANESCDPWTGR